MSPHPKATRGVNTSLYNSLSNDEIGCIEDAVWLRMTGCMNDARQIFKAKLAHIADDPIVIIERANVEHEAGRWGAAWGILDTALEDLRRADGDSNLPEYRLMSLMRAMFGVRHRGDLDSSVAELERARKWLCDERVDDFTDVQASCVRYYTIGYLLTRLSSNFHTESMEKIPMCDDETNVETPWYGLHDLRRSLVKRNMLNEANALFRVEINRTPLDERSPIFKEFLEEIEIMPRNLDRNHIESCVRLQWSTSYAQIGDAANAIAELDAAETAFNIWCTENGVTDNWEVPHFHALICAKLSMVGKDELRLQLAEQILAVLSKQTDGNKTGEILSLASDSAFALYKSNGDMQYLEKVFTLQERLEAYDEHFSEDLCDLITHRNNLISFTSTDLIDRHKSLEWIEGFFEAYPHFQSPTEMESLYRRRAILLRGLQRIEDSNEAEAKANILKERSSSLGNWINMKFTTIANETSDASGGARWADENEHGQVFFQAWSAVAGDQEKVVHTAINMLCRWASEDRSSGFITPQLYHKMMRIGFPDDQSTEKPAKDAQAGPDQELCSAIQEAVIPQDEITSEKYNSKWRLMVEWLSNPPSGQRMKRLFCLIMLRDARQYHFSDQKLWKLRIQELEQILEFHSILPPSIAEVTRSQRSAWLAALASTYIAQLGGTPDLSDPNTHALLLAAEDYCDKAIKELQRNHQPGLFLLQQRLGAQICLLKICRLEERLERKRSSISLSTTSEEMGSENALDEDDSIDALENEITSVRALGLAKVQESERLSTASELEASWSSGLEGVKERQRVLEFQASFWTVQNAIHLLFKDRNLSADTITSIWTWVQKYKARSLARTIGTRNDVPPSLLTQIRSSPEALSLYDEMLALQDTIDAAPLKARFELRRRMDDIRRRMKKDPILRRIIDLREGSPLDINDVKTIGQHAGRPLVLVDWFYLPPYPDNGIGRLLLFTLRACGTPTMDVLSTSIHDVQAWQEGFLNPEKLCLPGTRRKFSDTLAGLVAPLRDRTKPGEVLVFCPSATLHRLPLHALEIRDLNLDRDEGNIQPLIHRNPVVYIHSLSLLRSSFSAAEHAQYVPGKVNPQFLSGISKADETGTVNGRRTNYKAGRNSIVELAQTCGASPMIDESASKANFMEAMGQSRLLHLHTHCSWQFSDPLDHHVVFPNLIGSDEEVKNGDLKLTAKETFATRLVPGTHVNLIACQGGLLQVKMGDEVMGLVPALLYSGATSTVSTLWSIADQDGARFSKHMFDSFFDQCEEQAELHSDSPDDTYNVLPHQVKMKDVCFVDIAAAMQEAVIKMDPHWDQPLYHWAGFILHGYWMFSLSLSDSRRLGSAESIT